MDRRPPTRTCVACRTVRLKRDLVRIVRSPSGDVLLDQTGRVAGRGAYLCRDDACLTIASRKGAIGRALEHALPEDVHAALARIVATEPTENTGGEAHGQE